MDIKVSLRVSLHKSSDRESQSSALWSESRGPRFESRWRQNSAHDCTALLCTEPYIITLPSLQCDLYNVERDIKHQIIIIYSFC